MCNRFLTICFLLATAAHAFAKTDAKATAAPSRDTAGAVPVSLTLPQGYKLAWSSHQTWNWKPGTAGESGPKLSIAALSASGERTPLLAFLQDPIVRLEKAEAIEVNGAPAIRMECRIMEFGSSKLKQRKVSVWFRDKDRYYVLESFFEPNNEAAALKTTDAVIASIGKLR